MNFKALFLAAALLMTGLSFAQANELGPDVEQLNTEAFDGNIRLDEKNRYRGDAGEIVGDIIGGIIGAIGAREFDRHYPRHPRHGGVICFAQNRRGEVFRARGVVPVRVQDRAMEKCEWESRRCRPLGCRPDGRGGRGF